MDHLTKPPSDWLKTLYVETWKQYSHEDNLGQRRTTFFLAIQAAILSLGVVLYKPAAERSDLFVGLLLTATGGFLSAMAISWRSATHAGRAYTSLRWFTLRAIERVEGLDLVGPASLEQAWRKHSASSADQSFKPFRGMDRLGDLTLTSLPRTSGWASMLNLILMLQLVYGALLGTGLYLLACAIVSQVP